MLPIVKTLNMMNDWTGILLMLERHFLIIHNKAQISLYLGFAEMYWKLLRYWKAIHAIHSTLAVVIWSVLLCNLHTEKPSKAWPAILNSLKSLDWKIKCPLLLQLFFENNFYNQVREFICCPHFFLQKETKFARKHDSSFLTESGIY